MLMLSRARFIFAAIGMCILPCAHAAVTMDGSLGPKGAAPASGSNYSINAALGRRVGRNLFHSFSEFNLAQGESATFSSHVPVQNVLARVTGGAKSNINGKIICTIPGSSFYLINPAGVVFGPSARLDLRGSFYVATADEIQLTDGQHFSSPSRHTVDTQLSSAPPTAFGFLSKPRAITLNGTFLGLKANLNKPARFVMAGGEMSLLNSSDISAPNSHISLISANAPGEIRFPTSATPDPIVRFEGNRFARIAMKNSSIETNPGAGQSDIHASDLTLVNSNVTAATLGAAEGGGIVLSLTGQLSLDHAGVIASVLTGSGQGGQISITAKSLRLIHQGQINADTSDVGRGGEVSVHATGGGIDLLSGGQISAASLSSTDDQGTVIDKTGPAGDITVTATGRIRIDSQGALNDKGQHLFTGIDSQSQSSLPDGSAGNVSVLSRTLSISNGGIIDSSSFGGAPGGEVIVKAHTINVVGNPTVGTGITAEADGRGNAGDVLVYAQKLSVTSRATIASTAAFGDGGKVMIGSAHHPAGVIVLQSGGTIAARAAIKDAGDIVISSSDLILQDSRTDIPSAVSIFRTGGFIGNTYIATDAPNGNGGSIFLHISNRMLVDNSVITAAASVKGFKISIDPPLLLLQHSVIDGRANQQDVTVHVDPSATFIRSTDSEILSNAVTTPVEVDLAGQLVTLPSDLNSAAQQLSENCARRVAASFSSFVVEGTGGLPLEIDRPAESFNLATPVTRRAQTHD